MSDLIVTNLSVLYGRATAVEQASFTAPGGKITAIVGPNGAGKSSLALGVYGSIAASGDVTLGGEQLGSLDAIGRARAGVSIVPQGRQLFPRLTVRENLQALAEILKLAQTEVDAALDRFPILRERENRLAGVLSGGEQQMLVVSRALMGEPRALILDEMMTGLAPKIVSELLDTIITARNAGVAVLLLDPSLAPIKRAVDRGHVLMRAQLGPEVVGADALDKAYQRTMGVIQEEVSGE